MKTMKTRLLTLAVAGVSMLTLSACGGGPEASSLGTDDPIELAKIITEAVDNEDWDTYCAYLVEEKAMYVATYWTRSDDTCAGNLESVTYNSSTFSDSYLKTQGADIHWDTAFLDAGDGYTEVDFMYTPAGGGEAQERHLSVTNTEGIGWQIR